MKLQLPSSSSDNGRWRDGGQLGVVRTKNAQRKRLQIRRLSVKKKQVIHHHHYDDGNKEENSDQAHATEMSLSLTSSSPSSENSDVFEDKKTSSGSDFTCLSHGVASVVGRRKEMEDAVRVELGFMGGPTGEDHAKTMRKKYDFFGVYDGHGGARVAEACKERLHELLVEVIAEDHHHHHQQQQEQQKHLYWDWESVMEGCFGKMDEEANRGSLREEMVGSTAVVAVVGNDELVVANCGDSRALLSRGGLAVPLSVDHKPDRPDELKRVEAAGGRVINWNGPRILGVLATSRSIGDQYLKPFVISKPEVTVTKRTEQDEFLILASDGLWDVVSNEVACQVVRRCFGGRIKWSSSFDDRNQADRAAAVLAELAIARGSSDNITVVVVELNKPTKFN